MKRNESSGADFLDPGDCCDLLVFSVVYEYDCVANEVKKC